MVVGRVKVSLSFHLLVSSRTADHDALAAQGRMATTKTRPEAQTRKRRSALPAVLSDSEAEMQVDDSCDPAAAASKAKQAAKEKGKAPMATIDEESETELETDVEPSEAEEEECGENEHEDEDLQGLEGQAAIDALMQSVPRFADRQVSSVFVLSIKLLTDLLVDVLPATAYDILPEINHF